MKIRKAVKAAVTGAVFALPAVTANAVSLDFGVVGGTQITAADLSGMTCSATAGTEEGFLQRTCTNGSTNFIQTMVYESGGEGEFKDSSLVMTGDGNNGVANLNQITDASTGFTNISKIQTDTLATNNILGTGQGIDFVQHVNDYSESGQTFHNNFQYVEDLNGNGEISLTQYLKNAGPDAEEHISQNFDHYEIFATNSGSTGSPTDPGVTFASGDYITTTLINNVLPGLSAFSLQDFGNENTNYGTDTGVDSLATTGPHYAITYTGGTDIFTYQAFP